MKIPGLGLRITDWRPVLSGSISPAQAIIAAIEATDAGPQSDPTKTAITTAVAALQTAGVWSKLRALYGYVGGTANSHAINWKTPGTYDITWSGTVAHTSDGIQNTLNGYGQSALDLIDMIPNSLSYGFYSRTDIEEFTYDTSIGGVGNADLGASLFAYAFSNTYYDNLPNGGAGRAVHNGSGGSLGFICSSRVAGNDHRGYRDGVEVAFTSGAQGAYVAGLATVLSDSATQSSRSTRQHALDYFADGLTPTEMADFYTAIQALQTSLGRQV